MYRSVNAVFYPRGTFLIPTWRNEGFHSVFSLPDSGFESTVTVVRVNYELLNFIKHKLHSKEKKENYFQNFGKFALFSGGTEF